MSAFESAAQSYEKATVTQHQRRGACPSLTAPMATGDGLLVRLRPAYGELSLAQFAMIAQGALRHGNGLIDITARGNLQIRGLTKVSAQILADDLHSSGIMIPPGPSILIPPLHGVDPDERADAAALEMRIRRELGALLASPRLAPKLSIVIDAGGYVPLSAMTADIRIDAHETDWLLSIDGDRNCARPLAICENSDVIPALGRLLDLLIESGEHIRTRDLALTDLRSTFPEMDTLAPSRFDASMPPLTGYYPLSATTGALGVQPGFGQIKARDLLVFLDAIQHHDVSTIRLAPARGFFLLPVSLNTLPALEAAARNAGLHTTADHSARFLHSCVGIKGCASGFYDTRSLARQSLESATSLLDGSLILHLSGCSKSCAYQGPALTFAGTPEGYSIKFQHASFSREWRMTGETLHSAIEALAKLVEHHKQAGESALACLTRLGADTIAAAMRQES